MILKEQLAELPAASVATDVTVLVPSGNTDPEGGTLATLTTEQRSLAVTLNVTTAELLFASVPTVMLPGQVIEGG